MSNPFHHIDVRFNLEPLPSANEPIFLISSIWRSGSTLLQRCIASDHDITMWGEPYSDCNIIPSLSKSAIALTQQHWPSSRHFLALHPHLVQRPENYFVANMYPEVNYLRDGHRAMLDATFQKPAEALGKKRFGIKYVRLGLEEVNYLQWIYPDARFVFLIRNPWDCWKSYKSYRWLYRWPKKLITSVDQFAGLWQYQTSGLIHFEGKNQLWIRYEDFIAPDFDWNKLREFCRLPNINEKVLENRIKGVDKQPEPVTEADCQKIQKICGDLAGKLGYNGLKNTDMSFQWP